eukprot:CAMPEP_0177732406 /NCGR_PEP_ID=MMETSP0484_2-20121128/23091_1 /TAXON_ID=354590 /ORGANISM="Rhodomonas lens, Strain RHODO" /LENGTH=46 /DNA_ID= /DNA_START= /DNA_END= /DNA_ORIENTATION=
MIPGPPNQLSSSTLTPDTLRPISESQAARAPASASGELASPPSPEL